MPSWLYYFGRFFVLAFFLAFSRFSIKGGENVPRHGAVLVSANHLSVMDPMIVGLSLGRPSAFMAKEELFRSKLGGKFISWFGAFPVRRGRIDRDALRNAESVLSRQKALVMFPEGARASSEGHRPEGFLGAALIACRAGVPVLPVGITGTETITGWRWMLRRPRITVSIGRPFVLPASNGKGRREELEENTRVIMARIADLLPPQQRTAVQSGSATDAD